MGLSILKPLWRAGVGEGYTMWNLYCDYWMPFGELLTDMEREGMMVDRCAKCALLRHEGSLYLES